MPAAEMCMPPFKRSSGPAMLPPGPRPKSLPCSLRIHPREDPMRAVVESYIRQRYRQRFDAQVRQWLPTLVSLERNGEILAAAGYRDGSHPLFLEHYLAAPVERYVRDRGAPVARNLIVEAGQFAAVRPGAGRLLVPLLARHLRQQGYEWAVSTLTAELDHLFDRMGLEHQPIAIATADRLDEEERKHWGSYYTHAPRVFAASLNAILACFPEEEA